MDIEILATRAFVQAMIRHRHPRVVLEKIQLLATNPAHPSLRAHQFRRARKGIRECYTSDGNRMLYEFKPGKLCLWYLGTHALIEKAHRYRFDPEQIFYDFSNELKHANIIREKAPEQKIEYNKNIYEAELVFDETLLTCTFSWEELQHLADREGQAG